MKVYAFQYNPMIEESGFVTISIHKTKKGAEMAMEFHRNEVKKEFNDMYKNEKPPHEFGRFEAWRVEEMEILD